MSDNNNAILILGAVGLYMYMKKSQGAAQQGYYDPRFAPQGPQPAPTASMPGNVGNGWQQVATGAVAGFLGQLMNGPSNSTSQQYAPSYQDPIYRGGIMQESVAAIQSYDMPRLPVDIPFLDWV